MNDPGRLFPDTSLRQIFSYLDFSDVASCRLVSKQWHRCALDSFSFVLSLQDLDQLQYGPKPRQSQQMAASDVAAADDFSNWSAQAKLVPYPAWLDWKAAEEKALDRRVAKKPPEWTSCDQLVAAIKSSFERKIKHVVIKDIIATISSFLPVLAQIAPAAATISLINQSDVMTRFTTTTRFARQRQNGEFRCLELHMDAVVLDRIAAIMGRKAADYRLVSDNAGFIVRLSASKWQHVQTAIDSIEKENDCVNGLVFKSCEELLVEQAPPGRKPFDIIGARFPALRNLDYAIGGFVATIDVEPLEQLPNLASLVVRNESAGLWTLLPKLRFPSLVELRLGNDILLPEDQLSMFLPALTTLQLDAGIKNALRLSEFGVPILWNLTVLTTMKLPANIVKPFLRSVLPVAPKLQSLTIDLQLSNQLGRPVLTDIYDTLVVVPSCKAALTVGTFCIFPEAVDCRSLVQQRVADIKERSLKTPITIAFKDNRINALVNILSTAGSGGQGVVISATSDDSESKNSNSFELAWHNNVAGIQQKLKFRVSV